MRMREIAFTRVRYGYRRILTLLRREGYKDNHKRVYRIYQQEGLNLRLKRPRRSRMGAQRLERVDIARVDQVWSMDFVVDQFFNGSRFRILTVLHNYSKKSPGLLVDRQIKGANVVDFLNQLKAAEGCTPERIQVDNGSEFISKEMDRWAYENQVVLDFSRPGKPTDNPYIESFNGKFRDECLSVNWFLDLDDARQKIEAWRQEYNELRPHYSLSQMTPMEFIAAQ
jgi:putative transposase